MKRSNSATRDESSDLSNALKLEARLKQILSEKTTQGDTDAEAATLRMELCEKFSSILLDDPYTSLKKDIPNRLWVNCFYTQIQKFRSRIAKAKKSKNESKVQRQEQLFYTFLQEAITLYDFLIDQFQGKLLPDVTQTPTSQSTTNSAHIPIGASQKTPMSILKSQEGATSLRQSLPHDTPSSSTISPHRYEDDNNHTHNTNTAIIVLYRLYIYLGDLHRYRNENAQAEEAYTHASHLGPGKGNPYNQFAVIAQVKSTDDNPNHLTALYWYVRSLGAFDIFETSRGNLKNLLEKNVKWLKQHESKLGKDVDFGKLGDWMLNLELIQEKEDVKVKKAWMTRMVLGKFVDFIGVVLNVQDEKELDKLATKGQDWIRGFDGILEWNLFGDKLLIQMIAIVSYALMTVEEGHVENGVAETIQVFTYRFASVLSKYIIPLLEKVEIKLKEGKKQSSMRLLAPLILISELIMEVEGKFNIESQDVTYAKHDYWDMIALVAEKVTYSSYLTQELGQNAPMLALELPEDILPLSLGFKPLAFLDPNSKNNSRANDASTKHLYASVEQAMDALGLLSSEPSQSQPSQKWKKTVQSADASKVNVKSDDENNIKLARFMAFISKCLDEEKLVCLDEHSIKASHSSSEILNAVSMVVDETDLEPQTDFDTQMVAEILVYKLAEKGGPELLVPGALLHHSPSKDDDVEANKIDEENEDLQIKGNKLPQVEELLNPSTMIMDVSDEAKTLNLQNSMIESIIPESNQLLNTLSTELAMEETFASPPIRPPPGFGSVLVAQNHPLSEPIASDRVIKCELSDFTGGRILPPHQNIASLPNTRNPFASSALLHGGRTMNPPSNVDDFFSPDFNMDDDDRFGLKFLGIFGDHARNDSKAASHTGIFTRNPFA